MEINNLEYALNYFKKGLTVVPAYSPSVIKRNVPKSFIKKRDDAIKKNKTAGTPLSEEEILKELVIKFCKRTIVPWTEYQTRKQTENEVRNMFSQNPDANFELY